MKLDDKIIKELESKIKKLVVPYCCKDIEVTTDAIGIIEPTDACENSIHKLCKTFRNEHMILEMIPDEILFLNLNLLEYNEFDNFVNYMVGMMIENKT